jgi:hypothetical protein
MDCHEENAAMLHAQQTHLFPSFHLDSLLRSLHLSTVTAKPWLPPTMTVPHDHSRERLRAAIAQLGLPRATPASPCFTKSCADIAHAASNVETWLAYLPRNCVRAMVLDGWHWTT